MVPTASRLIVTIGALFCDDCLQATLSQAMDATLGLPSDKHTLQDVPPSWEQCPDSFGIFLSS
ncbi:MAG: hypothetical protein NVSMB27_29340 [Ktedonobacteraceae bacterium]